MCSAAGYLGVLLLIVADRSAAIVDSGTNGQSRLSQDLTTTVAELKKQLLDLFQKNSMLEKRVAELEKCDCHKTTCLYNGTTWQPGEIFYKKACTKCVCQRGQVTCSVDASTEHCRDFCLPNPCQNGGLCRPSRWPTAPERVQCHCAPGFQGALCDQIASFTCGLPSQKGSCRNFTERWFYNQLSGRCEAFTYSGCQGNANNFDSADQCRRECTMGACCYRAVRQYAGKNDSYGFNAQGYDRYGYSAEGYNAAGERWRWETATMFGSQVFKLSGFDWQGYDADGFNRSGVNRQGYDRQGFLVVTGYNRTGFNRQGLYDGRQTFDNDGFDAKGYGRDGFNCRGSNQKGYKADGTFVGLEYGCEYMSVDRCRKLGNERPSVEVIQFSPGKACADSCQQASNQGLPCLCSHHGRTLSFGDTAINDCGRQCRCLRAGAAQCSSCSQQNATILRLEVRDMSAAQLARYQRAVAKLLEPGDRGEPGAWTRAALMRALHAPHAHRHHFLPWHRRFLAEVEAALQVAASDCSIFIPYFDWTIDSSDLSRSSVWRASIFGGTGDEATGCVKFNPFASDAGAFPRDWSPCLQRQFDRSVTLPSPAVIEAVLREQTFASFEAKMKTISSLFHAFVGGHMATSYAAYDPVFLSHYTYVDKLWHDWQARNKSRYLDVNPGDRYKPIEPFDVSIDDVISSKDQLCIGYQPIGSKCHVDLPVPSVNMSKAMVYDSDGFDTTGYNANGYDIMGYNRHGYYIDGYNADGFNAQGFDRQGYDRHGFRQDGWSWHGLHRNGSYSARLDPVPATERFDANGYCRYGLNKYGVDVHGRDAYGYDSAGLDAAGCGAYFGWGEHLKSKRRLEIELEQLPDDRLMMLPRSCAHLVSTPQAWWFTSGWLPAPGKLCLLPSFRPASSSNDPADSSRHVWQPQEPGLRFCIDVNWFTGCHLGEQVADATVCGMDLCSSAQCRGYPEAQCWTARCDGTCRRRWFLHGQVITQQCLGCIDTDGFERAEGSRWQPPRSRCITCACERGTVQCGNVACSPAKCTHPSFLASHGDDSSSETCCPQCSGCFFEQTSYSNGEVFIHPNKQCHQCACNWGSVTCSEFPACPQLPSCRPEALVKQPGSCCPVCLDCGGHADQEEWTENSCVTCKCQKGQTTCMKKKCDFQCTHPAISSDPCCPSCTDCMYKGNIYRDGSVFQQPDTCEQCQCYHGNIRCEDQKCPLLHCPRQTKSEAGRCCPRCAEGCEYRGKEYANGVTFVADYNLCLECHCSINGTVKCSRIRCPDVSHLPCQWPATVPGECCPSFCPRCHYDGLDYDHGEQWFPAGRPCEVCVCYEGGLSCRRIRSCSAVCSHGTYADGECCSSCTDCFFEGSIIKEGERFVRSSQNGCYDCFCSRGSILCQETAQCPKLACTITEQIPGSCCPTCKGCVDDRGVKRRYGEEWEDASSEKCNRICTCTEGVVRCHQKDCPNLNCRYPEDRPGSCCPVCTECSSDGRIYRNGERFTARLDPCRACTCENGSVQCSLMSCPTVGCQNPILIDGRCCPACPVKQCRHLGIIMAEGQKVEDGCDVCHCSGGHVSCRRLVCPPASCSHPNPGQCCLECQRCFINGSVVQHGSEFPQPGNPCGVCSCNSGNIKCSHRICPAVACSHPANDSCCPSCRRCQYEGVTRTHGERFGPVGDDCHTCICAAGTVTCTPKACPAVACSNPIKVIGDCCATCSDCIYRGRMVAEGAVFGDGCRQCRCAAGVVICHPVQCGAISCTHPTQDECCPVCQDCFYAGQRLTNREVFDSPVNECQTCTCTAGNVTCAPSTCSALSLSCDHPAAGRCGCPDCHRCSYQGAVYSNGEVFPNRNNRCLTCQCGYGTVTCKQRACQNSSASTAGSAPACNSPDFDDCGCPVCGACSLHGKRFGNGYVVDMRDTKNYDPCLDCRCSNGNIECQLAACPDVPCTHPTRGQCCNECKDCAYLGLRLKENEVITDPKNSCRQCTCKGGSVTCSPITCGDAACSHPASGDCCPDCSRCKHEGVVYSNQTSFASNGGCSLCHCKNGNVTCEQKHCKALHCAFTHTKGKNEECCDTCQGCTVNGELHDHNSAWTSRSCQEGCSCHGGIVDCAPLECLTPCAVPIRSELHCCPLCPGCSLGGRNYQDGDIFTHPSSPCVVCHCLRGHLACMRRPCLSTAGCPRDRLVAPASGECCSTCLFSFNESCTAAIAGKSIMPTSDPCYSCHCHNGHWTCSMEVCMVPPCDTLPIVLPGHCCPICPVCNHKGVGHQNGSVWMDPEDSCVSCICKDGITTCDANVTCPDLKCSKGQSIARTPGTCCPVCREEAVSPRPNDSSCQDRDSMYADGERWQTDECTTCECVAGSTACTTEACTDMDCASDEVATLLPGVCCPRCIQQPATCVAYGDPHYKTFDGDTIHFQGFCKYVMAADCWGRQFIVEAEHDHRNTSSVSWVSSITIKLNSSVDIDLKRNGTVEVNGQSISLPFLLEPLLSIDLRAGIVLVNTAVGLKVHWDGDSHVEVKVSGDYKNRMCGLCGNFNNFPQDDMKTKQGSLTSSPAVFGNSWQVRGSGNTDAGCQDAVDVDPCAQAGYHAKRNAAAKCAVIMGGQFSRCHRAVSPDAYYASCTYDMCACYDSAVFRGGPNGCLCDVLSTYAVACSQAGVSLNWRTASLCAVDCDVAKGFIFDDCGPPCPRTCANHDRPPGQMEPHCYKPCVPSCQCPAGKVLHEGRCASPAVCTAANLPAS